MSQVAGNAKYWPPAAFRALVNGPLELEKRSQECWQYRTRLDHYALAITVLELMFNQGDVAGTGLCGVVPGTTSVLPTTQVLQCHVCCNKVKLCPWEYYHDSCEPPPLFFPPPPHLPPYPPSPPPPHLPSMTPA